jgi:hypothetical protein
MIRGRELYAGKATRVLIDRRALVETCKRCAFSLICLSGKHFDTYICNSCEAVWIDEIKTLVDCDAFEMYKEHDILPGCPACEPFETNPEEVTKVRGYQACKEKEVPAKETSHAADEE